MASDDASTATDVPVLADAAVANALLASCVAASEARALALVKPEAASDCVTSKLTCHEAAKS